MDKVYITAQELLEDSSSGVLVSTIHRAKGLEFDIVVLADLDVPLIGQPDLFVTHSATPTGPVQRVCRYASAELQKLLPDDLQQMFRDAADHHPQRAIRRRFRLSQMRLPSMQRAFRMRD